MAQASRYGGPSITPEEAADPAPPSRPIRVRRPELGQVDQQPFHAEPDVPKEVPPSVGNNSSQSTEKQQTSEEKPSHTPRKPARPTANRSKAPEKEMDSDADSTDGNGQNKESKQSANTDDLFDFDDI